MVSIVQKTELHKQHPDTEHVTARDEELAGRNPETLPKASVDRSRKCVKFPNSRHRRRKCIYGLPSVA